MAKKLVLVTTISTFTHSYVFSEEEGVDSSLVLDFIGDEDVEEMSQTWIGEQIISHRDITFEEYLKIFDKENDYLKDWSTEQKLKYILDPEELELKAQERVKEQMVSVAIGL
jgi:hypothetical protein